MSGSYLLGKGFRNFHHFNKLRITPSVVVTFTQGIQLDPPLKWDDATAKIWQIPQQKDSLSSSLIRPARLSRQEISGLRIGEGEAPSCMRTTSTTSDR